MNCSFYFEIAVEKGFDNDNFYTWILFFLCYQIHVFQTLLLSVRNHGNIIIYATK